MFETILVSACLLGLPTRYDGRSKTSPEVFNHLREKNLRPIPVCPEQLAGLPTPRHPCSFHSGDGVDLLAGSGRLYRSDGREMSASFLRGAEMTLTIARLTESQAALLKDGSPSCGVHRICRMQQQVAGQGVTAALLRRSGLRVYSEADL